MYGGAPAPPLTHPGGSKVVEHVADISAGGQMGIYIEVGDKRTSEVVVMLRRKETLDDL